MQPTRDSYGQGPSLAADAPAHRLSQSFPYVTPSQPHTGAKIWAQMHGDGRATQTPWKSQQHWPRGSSQKLPGGQGVPASPPHTAPGLVVVVLVVVVVVVVVAPVSVTAGTHSSDAVYFFCTRDPNWSVTRAPGGRRGHLSL
jgi:hypothetical protein